MSTPVSDLKWAGPDKNILCHCVGNGCLGDGTCKPGVSCVIGYFGHACQYVDGAHGETQSHPELTDSNDTTCMTRKDLNVVTITTAKTHARYFRLVFKKTYKPNDLMLTVGSKDPPFVGDCNGVRVYLSRTIMDFYCRNVVKIDQVVINGSSVPYLCSVHVSRGRNLALKAAVKMSSSFSETEYPDAGAVDGNRDSDEISCVHSSNEEEQPELNVTFPAAVNIDWFYIENRKNYIQRLKNFQLFSYSPTGQEVMFHNDTESSRQTIEVLHPYPLEPIGHVTLKAVVKSFPHYNSTILNICEIETYGGKVKSPFL
ncbi:hypothetical protein Btru_039589 [Bulinus truncatus]|nr:hypothetical protein Btru_039589 [Bulinus truncatus]